MTQYWPVSAPCKSSENGNVLIEEFTISLDEAVRANLRASRITQVSPGTFKRLLIKNNLGCFDVVMSNTRMEVNTNREFVLKAHGNVLVNGLGLGMVVEQLLLKPDVNHITIIEVNKDVIDLVGAVFKGNDRVTIINSCAFAYKPPRGSYFDAVWHDIWTDICGDNLAEMKLLGKKYARKSGWQGYWAKDLCKLLVKGYRI